MFHAYEWAGKSSNVTFTIPKGATGAILTKSSRTAAGSPLTITGDQLTVPIRPFEILALRVDYLHDSKPEQAKRDGDVVGVKEGELHTK